MQNTLFCRGYCLLNNSVTYEFPPYFNKYTLDDEFSFYADELNETSIIYGDDYWIVISGLVIDTYSPNEDIHSIAQNVRTYLSISEEYFLEYLDYLSGRFIIIYKYRNKCYFYHDACGMKSAFYTFAKNKIISSHYQLVKNISQELEPSYISQVSKEEKELFSYGYPGRTTPTKNIFHLTPNTRINITESRIERYFPREALEICSNTNTVELFVKNNFLNQIAALKNKNKKLVLSLTAGYDSRFTLAILKEKLNELIFFTYKSHEAHNIDLLMSKDIARKLNLIHRTFIIRNEDRNDITFKEFCNVISKNSFYVHNRIIAYRYWQSFSDKHIHIRSNLAEIGRLFYGVSSNKFTAMDMIKLWGNKKLSNQCSDEIKLAFDDFYITTNFNNIYNYNPNDLFYWEHRMGTWLSQVLVESDPAFDTVILFNNRKVLKMLLSIPAEQRGKNTVFSHIINNFLPELKDWPINPKEWTVIK